MTRLFVAQLLPNGKVPAENSKLVAIADASEAHQVSQNGSLSVAMHAIFGPDEALFRWDVCGTWVEAAHGKSGGPGVVRRLGGAEKPKGDTWELNLGPEQMQ